jgi:hypothetical protein
MNRLASSALCFLSILLLANFSSESSIDGKQKHKINFCGTFTDSQGNTITVDNISISGSYKHIPVYQKPTSPDVKPDINTTFIDLNEVAGIKLPSATPMISKFKNREYIDIVIIYDDKQQTSKNYIIELSRKILCDETNDAGPIEKEISFQALGELKITGYSHRDAEKHAGKKGQCKTKSEKKSEVKAVA